MKNGTALWENDWDKIGDIGKAHGFEWGGDWTSIVDKPHFQMDYGYTIGQLLEMYNQGKHENGYVKIE